MEGPDGIIEEERDGASSSGSSYTSDQSPLRTSRKNWELGYGRTGVRPASEDHPSGFYDCYLRVAGKFDRDFVKTRERDLNLILVPASLTFGTATAFIISINSDIERDSDLQSIFVLRLHSSPFFPLFF